ncbi:helix-turn-helix domain-containing protein [Janibacter limosus]|jgi:AcrR family transcriptional regulator/DNA-binding XRE family transcriptional regulator|uniref:Helix-turn-helix domain-containing protein n=1 Tax=Janibacter limosus TaxID=53458 RepID=A0A4P6MW88_9MICO|nr:helix-turn-helix domain-containing protein [Janibacter limosus]QBF46095.1 helix-turn-helix domain-containing protein [Janibacter limosus]
MQQSAEPSLHRRALGRAVRELRRQRGLTVRQLAHQIGVSIGTVSAIENGRVGISSERVVVLADALGVRADRLLVGIAEPIRDERWGTTPAGPGPAGHGDWHHYEPLELDPALRGALASFLEVGYHGSTMRGVAERAGLSVAGLYHYYSGKQQLLVAILDRTMEELQRRTTAASDAAHDPWTRFALLVECQALFHSHRRELGFIGATEMRSLAGPARERIARVRREEQAKIDAEVIAASLAGAFGTPRPREAARAVVTMCTAIPQWYRHGGGMSPEQVADSYVDFALDLVQCEPALRPQPSEASG